MRFTVIGHSCLYVETSGPTILVDPWLSGSCYWRSWWLDPPNDDLLPAVFSPDFVYLTHHHADHLHYPSMRTIDRGAHILAPKFGVDVMAGELRGLGFPRVSELPHGQVLELGGGVRMASYQYGFDDTTVVIADGDDVLVNVNDCKLRGRSVQKVLDTFGSPRFLFKTHSWAQGYPHCYTADDPTDLGLLTTESYVHDFLKSVRDFRPEYAVPVGSTVAFLHPDSEHMNQHLITAADVAEGFKGAADVAGTELVVMNPGDSWDRDDGFSLHDIDYSPEGRAPRLEARRAEIAPKLEAQAELEATLVPSWEAFRDHVTAFVKAVPPGLGGRMVPRPVQFWVPSSPSSYWVVDLAGRRVWRQVEPFAGAAATISVPEGVLADAVDKQILHFVQGSMRTKIHLAPGGVVEDLAFWGVLMIWEIGYLPLSRSANPRFAAALVRRWREAADAADLMRTGEGAPLERLAEGFAPTA
jgi:UDP-MurNAc hydroxylase